MPLINSRSKKALQKNIATEMDAHPSPKDRERNIAIAYSVKRKAKKMAEGGSISASNEKRPMPDDLHDDAAMKRRNSADHAPMRGDDAKTQDNISYQARTGLKTTKIKHPKMVASNVVQSRLRDEEDDLMDSMPPGSPKDQPPKADDEKGPNRQGPSTPDLKMKKMAYGGKAEDDGVEHPAGLEEDNDQMRPSEDEIMSDHMEMLAEGGEVHSEEEIEHAASLAAAIMMKRKKMAMGGEASLDTTDADQADLSRNADEDMNLEDQASFDAMRKENYSESEGLEQLDSPMDSAQHGHEEDDEHDRSIVGQIRSKMKKKSVITR